MARSFEEMLDILYPTHPDAIARRKAAAEAACGGMVHVRGYTQSRAGHQCQVSDYSRSAPARGAGDTNVPGKPYVSGKSIEEIMKMKDSRGYISARADKGRQECVALVKAAIPELGSAGDDWRKGPDITGADDPNLKPGTAIGYGFDKNGRYPNKGHGNHVAIVVGVATEKDGTPQVKILEQFSGQIARFKTIDANKIRNWSTITRKP